MAANSLWVQYKTANVAIKLIAINTVVFLFFGLMQFVFAEQGLNVIEKWFVLPSDLSKFILQPWGVITYAFLHGGLLHLLFNMLFFYVFAQYVLNLFTEKRLLTIYLLGAMAGALFFLLAYNLFPVFSHNLGYLVGASAAVNAVIVFAATYTPNASIRVFFFNLKLWHVAAFVVLRDLVSIIGNDGNAGGLIAHLGGALFGYVYALQLAKGNDIGLWFERFIDSMIAMFKGVRSTDTLSRKRTSKNKSKSPLRTVHRNKKNAKKPVTKTEKQQQIDAILDKISKSGYDSLTKAEKDFLFQAGKD